MRFSLFAHMERINTDQTQQQLYEEFIELCKLADESGFSTIWTGEHHGMNFTIAPNPFLNLVDLAHHTKNVRLGTSAIVAPFWHPIRVAGEAAMTDMIVQGRLEIGLARGAYSYEYDRIGEGVNAWDAGQKLREMVPAIKGLWQGDYEHDGENWQFPKTTSSPKPIQQPHPPLWLAVRDPNSFEFALNNGCNIQVTPLWFGDDEVESLMQKFNDACALAPSIPRPEIMVLRHTFVGEDEQQVEHAAKHLSKFYCHFGAWFKDERPISQGLIQPLSDDEMAKIDMYSPQKMRENNIVGTPEEVIQRIKSYQDMGYDEYSYWIDNSMTHEDKRRSLELFIEKVMPAFKETN